MYLLHLYDWMLLFLFWFLCFLFASSSVLASPPIVPPLTPMVSPPPWDICTAWTPGTCLWSQVTPGVHIAPSRESGAELGSRPSLNWLETFSTNYRISFELITWERLDQFRHLTSLLPGLPLPRSRYSPRQWWRGLGDQGTGHMQPGQHCAPSEQRPPEKLRSWYYG